MIRIAIAMALATVTLPASAKGDIEAGRAKAQTCQACHGANGNGMGDPQYPRLAGQHADYLEKALKDYRSGQRSNAIMAGFAATLSDQDIRDLAAFYAAQKGPLRDLSHTR
jgi:cytochrome c553